MTNLDDLRKRLDRIERLDRDLSEVCRQASRLLCCPAQDIVIERAALVEVLDRIAGEANGSQ